MTNPKFEIRNSKHIAGGIILIMLLGGLGGILLDRVVFPYLSTLAPFRGIGFFSNAPLVINRREEIRFVEGINQAEVLSRAKNSLVTVYAHKGTFDSGKFELIGRRSGVAVTSDGLVATSLEGLPVAGVSYTLVRADGQSKTAFVAGTDRLTGITLLKAVGLSLPVSRQGFASSLNSGEKVLAVWAAENPGAPAAISASALRPAGEPASFVAVYDMSAPSALLPLDWTISEDALGGAVLDKDAQLVGLVVSQGQKFMILPAEYVKLLLDNFLGSGAVAWPAWKARYQVLGPAQTGLLGLPKTAGILLKSSFGAFKENDFIYAADDQTLPPAGGFQAFILSKRPGDKVRFNFLRDGQEREVEAQL